MKRNEIYDLIVVGSGPAGMAAAVSAKAAGLNRLLLIDRSHYPGGILSQCIHDGFGLSIFERSLTGPEYSAVWEKKMLDDDIQIYLDTTVLQIEGGQPFLLRVSGPETGLCELKTKSIVLATGCRERSLGQLRIPGSRPAGVYTAGSAQYMMNIQNYLPGKAAVILGTGDIGLIMARRLTLEGAKVKMILGEEPSGLPRNYVQCVRDFDIPIRFGYTVASVHGYKRLKGVTIAPVASGGMPSAGKREYVSCDTLLVAAGLIPEDTLWVTAGYPKNGGAGVPADENMKTPVNGIFACGNAVRVYDTVDEVSQAGTAAGKAAAEWVLGGQVCVKTEEGGMSFIHPRCPINREEIISLFDTGCTEEIPMICTVCPKGCRLSVTNGEEGVLISGNGCEKGVAFAKNEIEAPKRTVTTTIRLSGCGKALLPVRTNRSVPLEAMKDVVCACKQIVLTGDIPAGRVITANVCGAGADLIATGSAMFERCPEDGDGV